MLSVGKLVPDLVDGKVGQEHRRVIGTVRVFALPLLIQEAIVDGADQRDRHELEIVAEEAQLAAGHLHFAVAEISKHFQMPRFHLRRLLLAQFEGARRQKHISVEGVFQPGKKRFERRRGAAGENLFETFAGIARNRLKALSTNDFAVFQIRNEHRLHQKRLRAVCAEIALEGVERRDEIVQ